MNFNGGVINVSSGALQQGGNQVLHAGNYTSYAPSLTGSGASGTWGISISGNAATATNATDSTKLPLSGGTLTGNLLFGNATSPNSNYIQFGDNTGWVFRFMTNVSGTPTQRFAFTDGGNFTATGNVTAFSDVRLKEGLEPIADALERLQSLTGYTYTRIDTGERHTGLIAQEVQKVLPEAVMDNGEHLSLAYGNMVGLLIEAIKEQQAQIDELRAKIEGV
jgi:hypothetical protein